MRRAQSRQPRTYTCPFCNGRLHAMSEHVVLAPEGDVDRRRHAHSACVERARRDGRLATYDEWRKTQPRGPSLLGRLLRRR
jgi:hypothetical protein